MAGMWPPPGQPRLPVGRTAINTAALLASGVLLWLANRYLPRARKTAQHYLEAAIFLGGSFVCLQGVEWVRLIREGLTLTSSSHGSFFYLIVGTHALHAVAAIVALGWVYTQLRRGNAKARSVHRDAGILVFRSAVVADYLCSGLFVRWGS